MPGSSLWLVPPPDSPLYKAIHSLINTEIPSIYPTSTPPHFTAHVTLTADTVPSSDPAEAQEWLDNIELPESISKLKVAIQKVQVGSIFFQKLTMRCEKNAQLCELAMYCRKAGVEGMGMQGARYWVEENYGPHCSLMYSDLPEGDVTSKLDEVNKKVQDIKRQSPESKEAKGGLIWLVPTFMSIEDWKPIATRKLSDVEWEWQT